MALSPGEQYSGGNVIDASQRMVVAVDNSSSFNVPGFLPGVVAPPGFGSAWANASAATVPIFTPRGFRVIVPKSGTLHDLAFMPAVQSGNCATAIYDTGDAAGGGVGTRTLLYSSGSLVVGAANAWQTTDPALAVTAGQQLDFWLMPDNTTATFYRTSALTVAQLANYPASFNPVPGGASSKLVLSLAARASLTDWPATIVDGSVSTSVTAPALIARVA